MAAGTIDSMDVDLILAVLRALAAEGVRLQDRADVDRLRRHYHLEEE